MIPVNDILGRNTFFFSFNGNGHTVFVGTADKEYFFAFQAEVAYVNICRNINSGQVTDSYLLALARAHGGQLATFDRRMVIDAVAGGVQTLHLIAGA